MIAVGVPCRVLREIIGTDKKRYPIYKETKQRIPIETKIENKGY